MELSNLDKDVTVLSVEKDGFEFASRMLYGMSAGYVVLPSGSIERLIGRKLTWEDEPVELTEATVSKPVEVTDEEIRNESYTFDMSNLDHTTQMLFTSAFQAGAKWMRERMTTK